MKAAVFAYSRRGCATARRLTSLVDCAGAYAPERLSEPDFLPLGRPTEAFYGELFRRMDALIFVGSCGIAVRQIAPHVRDKKTDPAVLCVDELGRFVIPILSGHIGGANALAAQISARLDAVAVITTATDINGRFSVDAWAARNGFRISSMALAKAVSAAILERDLPIRCSLPVTSDYPPGTYPGETGELGIYIGWERGAPFDRTLRLIPRCLHVGIGCRRGTPAEAIAAAVDAVLRDHGIDPEAVACAASIDLKADEAGLLAFCADRGWPIRFYSPETLSALTGDFTPSSFVRSVTGVDNVCERSAMVGADRLIVKKTAGNGVTVAIAAERCEVCFG